MPSDKDKTTVIFRTWKDTSTVIALFPEEVWSGAQCSSYEHIGQHGGADYDHVVSATRPAKPNEYDALKRELEGIGYNLEVRAKRFRR